MLPFSIRLRYLIPPHGAAALSELFALFHRLASSGAENVIAIYADDLEKAAGVGGWDPLHARRYEKFLRWLANNRWVKPVLINDWADGWRTAGERVIERGTFYELAQSWKAGEDYRGWSEDPHCLEYRQHLSKAEQALIRAAGRGANAGLLEVGWKHLLHCAYETTWHNPYAQAEANGDGAGPGDLPMEGWAAALSSHARSCLVIAAAAAWMGERDGAAHAERADIDLDGETELILKNDQLFAVFSPQRGGRLVYLFDLTGRRGRLMIGNVSDDWNLQQELSRYMDRPRNHPGALAEVGYEHDRYQASILMAQGASVAAILRNVQPGSQLYGAEKRIHLAPRARHLRVSYRVPHGVWRLSTEICLSPDYYRLLRYGRDGVSPLHGPDWRGWSNGAARAWVRIDPDQFTIWDKPYEEECGHGLNLRVSSFAHNYHVDIGVGPPPQSRYAVAAASPQADGGQAILINFDEYRRKGKIAYHVLSGAESHPMGNADPPSSLPVANPHFMRRFFQHHLREVKLQQLKVRACRVGALRVRPDRLTLAYTLLLQPRGSHPGFQRDLVGLWRRDGQGRQLHELMQALWQAGFDGADALCVPRPLGYWHQLDLLLTDKAPGTHLRQWVYNPNADWAEVLGRVAAWLARLHGSRVSVARRRGPDQEVNTLQGWLEEFSAADRPWLTHERGRIQALLKEMIARLQAAGPLELCLTHGDFHLENILVRGQAITGLDFEHSAMADPAVDLGYLLGQIDLQADRYWLRQRRHSPFHMGQLTGTLCDHYCRTRPSQALALVPFYQAHTYLKHLIHTARMKGAEAPDAVSLWLDKAAACLQRLQPVSQSRQTRRSPWREFIRNSLSRKAKTGVG